MKVIKAILILIVSILLKIVLAGPRLVVWMSNVISVAFKILSKTINFFIEQVETEVLK
jgi:hypothetical protein